MAYEFHHTIFSGPLELLLDLIERKEKEITEVSLSEVTEEFLEYLEKNDTIPAEELTDFLVVAARLLLLKSHALLPKEALEEEEVPLEAQLRIYKQFVEAGTIIQELWNRGVVMYGRTGAALQTGFYPPPPFAPSVLHDLFKDIVGRITFFRKLPEKAMERVMTLKEKIQNIRQLLARHAHTTLKGLLNGAASKTELIITFLALLELVKQREIMLSQQVRFSDIHIHSS